MISQMQLRPLKQALLDHYGSFGDLRIKKIDSGSVFIADDRHDGDFDARKSLFLLFCAIFAEVVDPAAVKVTLYHRVPRSAAVATWAQANAEKYTDDRMILIITPERVDRLNQLADQFRAIVRPGAPRYTTAEPPRVCRMLRP